MAIVIWERKPVDSDRQMNLQTSSCALSLVSFTVPVFVVLFWALHLRRRAPWLRKRALHLRKRVLSLRLHKRALYLHSASALELDLDSSRQSAYLCKRVIFLHKRLLYLRKRVICFHKRAPACISSARGRTWHEFVTTDIDAKSLDVSTATILKGYAQLSLISKQRFIHSVFTKDTLDEKGQARDTRVHVTLSCFLTRQRILQSPLAEIPSCSRTGSEKRLSKKVRLTWKRT